MAPIVNCQSPDLSQLRPIRGVDELETQGGDLISQVIGGGPISVLPGGFSLEYEGLGLGQQGRI